MLLHILRPTIAALTISLLFGCTITTRLNPQPQTAGLPTITKYPVHAGVYYSPQFADQEQTRKSATSVFIAQIGPASVQLFDDILARVFEKTSRISTLSANEFSAKQTDLVLVPSVEHFDFRLGVDADSDRYSITYRTTLYTDQGVPAASWLVSGKERGKTPFGISGYIENDMLDAATKFLQGFERSAGPALAAIARHSKEQIIPVDPGSVVLTAKRVELPDLDPGVVSSLRDAGMVAIRLTAQSTTSRKLVVRASDTRLQLKEGLVVEPARVSSVLSLLDKTSQTGAMVGGLFGFMISMSENDSQQKEREMQSTTVGRSLFRDRMLSEGKEEGGIVPFLVPNGSATSGHSALTVWVVDPASADGVKISVPISNMPK